jgi:integrase
VELYKEKPRDRVISLEEFETLTSHMPEHTADITTVAYYSGMRKGEILSLKWGQVNLAERLVYLEETKNDEPRKVYLDERLMEIFRRSRFQHPKYVFIYDGQPIRDIRRSFKRACRLADIGDFRFHDLRRCFRTNLRKAGVDQSVSMKMLGHKTLQAHEIYNATDRDDAMDAYGKLARYLGN